MNGNMEDLEAQVNEMKMSNVHVEIKKSWKTNLKQKIVIATSVVIVLIMIIIVGLRIHEANLKNDDGHTTACTEEAKICQDGSSVGRTGPDCAFAACPIINSLMSETKARTIAIKTCIKGGEVLADGIYNKNTKTWWYDANLNSTPEGCNPACVVSEKTKKAEINMRCTGLDTP